MIELLEVKPHLHSITDAYFLEDINVVSISNELSQDENDGDYTTIDFGEQSIITQNSIGEWADFECIGPTIITNATCKILNNVRIQTGTPIFNIKNSDNVISVCKCGLGFEVWLQDEREVNRIIKNDVIEFMFDNNELVGIKVERQIEAKG